MSESQAYSVSALNEQVRALLLDHFDVVTVTGEISNFRAYESGHWYFTLKDSKAEVRCAMFRGDNQQLTETFADGDAVSVRGRVELYTARGSYQIVVRDMAAQGQGALLQKIAALKAKLEAEGLFAPERKQELPDYPERIGIVTSPQAAALADVRRLLRRRWPVAELFLYPTPVQGQEAPAGLVDALELAASDARCDVLLLVRGGGSIEDLMAFNDEAVVRAVAAQPIPIVAGVGHETDTMLVDFAADVRAATPTAAAELASPDGAALTAWLADLQADSLPRHLEAALAGHNQTLDIQLRRLERAHPRNQIQVHQQRLDDLTQRARWQIAAQRRAAAQNLALLGQKLLALSPARTLGIQRLRVVQAARSLAQTAAALPKARASRLERAEATLQAVSPQRTLDRGYAIARLKKAGKSQILRDATEAEEGATVDIQLGSGEVETRVTATRKNPGPLKS